MARRILWARAGTLAGALPGLFLLRAALACPYTIREIGFAPLKREPYKVCLVVGEGDLGSRAAAAFRLVAGDVLRDSNVVAEVVPVGRLRSHPKLARLPPSILRSLPRAFLVAPWGSVLPLPKVDFTSRKAVRGLLEAVVSSPLRRKIVRGAVRDWCAVLLVEGPSRAENERAAREIERAGEKVEGEVTSAGVVIKRGPRLIRVSPGEARREAVLLWSLGLLGAKETCAVVLFGRGQQIGPVLKGREIEERTLVGLFRILGRTCSCTTDVKWLSGRRLPLRWDSAIREEVCERLGFDPESPEVAASLASVGINVERPELCRREILSYTEAPLEGTMEGEAGEPTTVSLPTPGAPQGPPQVEQKPPAAEEQKPPKVKRSGPAEGAVLGYREFVADEGGYRERTEPRRKVRPEGAQFVALPPPPPPEGQVTYGPAWEGRKVAQKGKRGAEATEVASAPHGKSPGAELRRRMAEEEREARERAKGAMALALLVLLCSSALGAFLVLLQRRRRGVR